MNGTSHSLAHEVQKLIGEAHAEAESLRPAVELERAVEFQREPGARRQETQVLLELGKAHRFSAGD